MSFVLTRPNPDSGPVVADGSASLRVVAFDLEINPETGECLDMGAVDSDGGRVHGCVASRFRAFWRAPTSRRTQRRRLRHAGLSVAFRRSEGADFRHAAPGNAASTALSPSCLPKEAPADPGTRSNPLADAETSFRLLIDLVGRWRKLPEDVRRILVELLSDVPGFSGFFRLLA